MALTGKELVLVTPVAPSGMPSGQQEIVTTAQIAAIGGGGGGTSATITGTGNSQGTAAPLVSSYTIIIAGSAGTGVRAPAGSSYFLWNQSGITQLVWPDVGATFSGYTLNQAVSLPNATKVDISYTSPTQGYIG